MLTPAISVAMGSSRIVVCRAQPPSSRRLWLSAKDHLRLGSVPWSVKGGASRSGSWASRGGFVGPRIDAPWLSRIGWGGVWTAGCGRPRIIEAPPFRLAKLIVVACRVHTNGSQPQRECQKICRCIAQTAHRWAPGRRDRYHVTGTLDGLGFRTTVVHQSTWQIVLGPAARGRDSFTTKSSRVAVEDDTLVTRALKAPHDVGANASEANHSKLHHAAPADWL